MRFSHHFVQDAMALRVYVRAVHYSVLYCGHFLVQWVSCHDVTHHVITATGVPNAQPDVALVVDRRGVGKLVRLQERGFCGWETKTSNKGCGWKIGKFYQVAAAPSNFGLSMWILHSKQMSQPIANFPWHFMKLGQLYQSPPTFTGH